MRWFFILFTLLILNLFVIPTPSFAACDNPGDVCCDSIVPFKPNFCNSPFVCDYGTNTCSSRPSQCESVGHICCYSIIPGHPNFCNGSVNCNPDTNRCEAITCSILGNACCNSIVPGKPNFCIGSYVCDQDSDSCILPQLCDNRSGVSTPFGCLPFAGASGAAKSTVDTLSNWAVVISGTIAIFIILFASLQIATATGDPKRLKAGQELLFSGLAGLFLISIAITILNFLGVKVLGLDLLGFIV